MRIYKVVLANEFLAKIDCWQNGIKYTGQQWHIVRLRKETECAVSGEVLCAKTEAWAPMTNRFNRGDRVNLEHISSVPTFSH